MPHVLRVFRGFRRPRHVEPGKYDTITRLPAQGRHADPELPDRPHPLTLLTTEEIKVRRAMLIAKGQFSQAEMSWWAA